MTPDQKGAIAEMKIATAAIEFGVGVLKPLNDGLRYDLVFDVGRLLRVQCKWAAIRRDVVVIPCRTCRRGPNGFIRTHYKPDEVDAVAAYCSRVDRCYLLLLEEFGARSVVTLRLAPSRNNQRLGVNWAEDFEFAATLRRLVGP